MVCSRCSTENVAGAHFCSRCGEHLFAPEGRRAHYAADPHEPVATVSVTSTLMPHAAGGRHHTYRLAILVGLAIAIAATASGLLSFGIVAAALVVPVVYVLYLYDVDVWEDEPLTAVLLTVVLTAILAVGFTYLWREVIFPSTRLPRTVINQSYRAEDLLVLCLFVPAGVVLLGQVGPVLLSRRPKFDELFDGLVFGVVAGVTFAAFETLVSYHSLITDLPVHVKNVDGAFWVTIMLVAGIVKPLVYGTTLGLVGARYTGVGPGTNGFRGRYGAALVEAFVALVAYQSGLYLLSRIEGTGGTVLGALWGAVLASVLLLRLRVVLHDALLEEAIEAVRSGVPAPATTQGTGYCPNCHMPLFDGSLFCVRCGMSVQAMSKAVQAYNLERAPNAVAAGTPRRGSAGGEGTR